jgi:hypothetical protein
MMTEEFQYFNLIRNEEQRLIFDDIMCKKKFIP